MRNFWDRVANDPVYFAYRLIGYGLVVVLLALMFGCAATVKKDGLNDDGSMTYTLTPEQVAQCVKEGGCSTVTLEYEKQLVRDAARHFCGVDI